MEGAHFVAQTGSGEEVRLAHGQLVQTLDELLRKTFSDWSRGVDRLSIQRLEQPLMLRCRQENTMLDVNFDKWVALSRGGGGGGSGGGGLGGGGMGGGGGGIDLRPGLGDLQTHRHTNARY